MYLYRSALLKKFYPVFQGIFSRRLFPLSKAKKLPRSFSTSKEASKEFKIATDRILLAEQVKQSLQLVPSSVSVITCDGPESDSVIGITVTSVVSLSMNPPLLTFNIKLPSRFSARLRQVKHCGVNVLSSSQSPYADILSRPGDKIFKDDSKEIGLLERINKVPIISESVASFLCQMHKVIAVADHEIWIVEILEARPPSNSHPSLLYHKRSYHQGPS